MKDNLLTLKTKDEGGKDISYTVRLTFAEDGTCTLSSDAQDVVVSGRGKFVSKGEKNQVYSCRSTYCNICRACSKCVAGSTCINKSCI